MQRSSRRQTLYHFTALSWTPSIFEQGFIDVTESNISRSRAHAGPDVVWLTADDVAPDAFALGLDGSAFDKTQIRFTVFVPAYPWAEWASSKGVGPSNQFRRSLSEGRRWRKWYVLERPILRDEWIEVLDTRTGRLLDGHHGGPAGGQPRRR